MFEWKTKRTNKYSSLNMQLKDYMLGKMIPAPVSPRKTEEQKGVNKMLSTDFL